MLNKIPSHFKKLFLNFSFRSSADLLGRFFGILTFPIVTRALEPAGYGNFTLVTVIIQFTFLPVAILGLRSYGIREIAQEIDGGNKVVNKILSSQLSIIIAAIPISLAIVIYLFNSNIFLIGSITIGYLSLIANVFNLDFFFIARKNLILPAISTLIGQGFLVVGVVLLIRDPHDLPLLIFLMGASPSIATLIQIAKYLKLGNKIIIGVSLREAFVLLKKTYMLGLSANLEVLYPTIPLILLPIILNNYYLGIYSAGYKVFSIMVLFYVTFFFAIAPYIVKLKEFDTKRKIKYIFLLFNVVTVGGIIIGLLLFYFGEPLLNLLLGKSFGESVSVFKVISLTLIPFWPVLMLAGNIFIYFGTEKYYLLSILVATLVVTVSAPFLIVEHSVLGAVYSMAISLFAALLTAGYFMLKIEPEIALIIRNKFFR